MTDETNRVFAHIKLSGARFKGGKLPVDALEEIQRYQSLVIAAAEKEWTEKHPGEDIPKALSRDFKLVITGVEDGSAQVTLEREETAADEYEDLYTEGQEELVRELTALLDADSPISESPLFELKDFRSLGSSLTAGDSIQLDPVVREGEEDPREKVSLTANQVAEVFPTRARESDRERRKRNTERLHRDEQAIAGRLVSLDADRKKFVFKSLHFGELSGTYKNDELTADLREVLDSTQNAAVVRLSANVQFRDDRAWRIREVNAVELLEIDGHPWSRKIVELASLAPDWGGELPGAEMISFAALEAARDLVLEIVKAGLEQPGIFPTEQGGVSLEWADESRVVFVEITSSAESYELYHLPEGSNEGRLTECSDIKSAFKFVQEVISG